MSRFDISNCLAPISRITHGELSEIWIKTQLPATLMGFVVMPTAKWNQVVEIGRPAIFPVVNMVNRAKLKWPLCVT